MEEHLEEEVLEEEEEQWEEALEELPEDVSKEIMEDLWVVFLEQVVLLRAHRTLVLQQQLRSC